MSAELDRLGLATDRPPSSMALVVVDMQYFDAHRDWGEGRTAKDLGVADLFEDYFAQIDRITPAIAALLDLFRSKAMEVIHLRVAELTRDSRDVGYKQLVRGLVVPSDSKEAEFLPGLEPTGDEIAISKSSSGVFAATNVDRILRNLGIETLVFTGTSTGGCVQSAVYDATDLGYRSIVVTDACADSTTESQAACLEAYAGQAVELVTSAALSQALAQVPDVDAAARSGVERVRQYRLDTPYAADGSGAVEPYAAIFGPAIELGVSPETSALVLIDAQRLTFDPALAEALPTPDGEQKDAYYARAAAAVVMMRQLLASCRTSGVPVFHIRSAHQLAGGRDLPRKRRAAGLAIGPGEPGADVLSELQPVPGEGVLSKPGSSIFNGTGLDTLLRNAGVETLIVAGASLDSSIEASLRSAGDRGYGSVLVPEACVGPGGAETRFRNMERGIINVRDVSWLVARLGQTAKAAS